MALQDEVTFVLRMIGHTVDVIGLDLLAFRGLHESCERLHALDMLEKADIEYRTSQGSGEDVANGLKRYENKVKLKPKEKGAAEFLARFPKGI